MKKIDKEARRAQIIDAAIHLFAKKGVVSTTIQEIADVAGIGKGTIYEYFRSKDELLAGIFNYIMEDSRKFVEERWKQVDDPLEKFYVFFDSLIGYLEQISENVSKIVLLFWAEGIIQGDKEEQFESINYRKIYTEYIETISRIISQCQKKGIFRDNLKPEVIASSLIGALDGVLFQYHIVGEQIQLRENVMTLLEIVITELKIQNN